MDDFMGKVEAISRAKEYAIEDDGMRRSEFENYRKAMEELANKRFRCVSNRIKSMEERVDICMRIAALGFVASITALVIAMVV